MPRTLLMVSQHSFRWCLGGIIRNNTCNSPCGITTLIQVMPWWHYQNQYMYQSLWHYNTHSGDALVALSEPIHVTVLVALQHSFRWCLGGIIRTNTCNSPCGITTLIQVMPWWHYQNQYMYQSLWHYNIHSGDALVALSETIHVTVLVALQHSFRWCLGGIIRTNTCISPCGITTFVQVMPWWHYKNQYMYQSLWHYNIHSGDALVALSEPIHVTVLVALQHSFRWCLGGIIRTNNTCISPCGITKSFVFQFMSTLGYFPYGTYHYLPKYPELSCISCTNALSIPQYITVMS